MTTAISDPKKPKTRPMFLLYCALGAVAIYVVFLYTQPTSTTSGVRHVAHLATLANTTDNSPNLTPQDLKAHFPRYASVTKRDPFLALIGTSTSGSDNLFGTVDAASGAATGGTWALTGINTVNGILSAVIENSTTGEVAFVQPGDTWKGLRVTEIDQTTVHFVNPIGQETTLTFAPPKVTEPTVAANPTAARAVPGLSSLPALGAFGSPLSTDPTAQPAITQPFGGGGGGGRRGGRGGGGGFGGFGGG